MIRALVVDDEPLARKGLRLRLAQMDDVTVIGECGNGREALASIQAESPDVVFLDIQMPGMDGFDVVANLQQENLPLIIFVTAYDQYAVEAFDVHAIDYLLKPVDEDRLAAALEQARQRVGQNEAVTDKQRLLDLIVSLTGRSEAAVDRLLQKYDGKQAYPRKLPIRDGGEVSLIPIEDIAWIDAAGDYMCVHADGETHVMRSTMSELEKSLDPMIFQRVHRSTIVNVNRVSRIQPHNNGEYHLVLDCDTVLKMSRSYREKVQHFF